MQCSKVSISGIYVVAVFRFFFCSFLWTIFEWWWWFVFFCFFFVFQFWVCTRFQKIFFLHFIGLVFCTPISDWFWSGKIDTHTHKKNRRGGFSHLNSMMNFYNSWNYWTEIVPLESFFFFVSNCAHLFSLSIFLFFFSFFYLSFSIYEDDNMKD